MPRADLHGLVLRLLRKGPRVTAAWWTGRAIGFDLETDGKDPEDARIITANATRLEAGVVASLHDWMAQPERDIPAEAAEVHGISTERARAEGKPRADVVADIVAILSGAGHTCPVVGHNLAYDLTVLDREMRRLGLGSVFADYTFATGLHSCTIRRDGRTVADFFVIDTLVLDKAVDRYRPGKRQLSFVAEHYAVPMAEGAAHEAGADVLASLRIAWRMADMCTWAPTRLAEHYADRKRPSELAIGFNGLADMSLANMHKLQMGWSAEQADGLREHFIRNPDKGDPAGVTGAWPVRPITTVTTERTTNV